MKHVQAVTQMWGDSGKMSLIVSCQGYVRSYRRCLAVGQAHGVKTRCHMQQVQGVFCQAQAVWEERGGMLVGKDSKDV